MSGDIDDTSDLDPEVPDGRSTHKWEPLNSRQEALFTQKRERFREYLKEEGKEPMKGIGYAEDSIPERVSRFDRVIEWVWENIEVTTEFTTDHADSVVKALATDELRRRDGERYAEDSKRKITDAIANWLAFQGEDWEPEVTFSEEGEPDHADPFTKPELRLLWQAALEYKSIPSYNNLSPEQRDRWKAHLAQELGKPKKTVRPADWNEINNLWDIPSLIRTTREAGWRPDLIGRLPTDWYFPEDQMIVIPAGEAPKNDARWEQVLSDEAAFSLNQWLDQRETMEMYDGRDEIWLNRQGNPYNSGSLNNLLRNLMDDAGINPRGRKLVWYSFRHSIGTIVYDEYKDLNAVAEALRQKSRESAARYVHPTHELKKDMAELM